jgi:hypothetical protein
VRVAGACLIGRCSRRGDGAGREAELLAEREDQDGEENTDESHHQDLPARSYHSQAPEGQLDGGCSARLLARGTFFHCRGRARQKVPECGASWVPARPAAAATRRRWHRETRKGCGNPPHGTDLLRGLLEEELRAREDNQYRRRLKEAAFPFEKTLDEFDFRLRPELNRQVIVRYLDDRFITQGRSLVLIGPAGFGKKRLAISLGQVAANADLRRRRCLRQDAERRGAEGGDSNSGNGKRARSPKRAEPSAFSALSRALAPLTANPKRPGFARFDPRNRDRVPIRRGSRTPGLPTRGEER